MLEQQFYSKDHIAKFIHKNFIPFRAVSGTDDYAFLRKHYTVRGTPKELILKAGGTMLDKISGMADPTDTDGYLERIKNSIAGEETLSALEQKYKNDPQDASVALHYAKKLFEIYKFPDAAAVLKGVISRKGNFAGRTIRTVYENKEIPAHEYALYLYGYGLLRNRKGGKPDGLEEFLRQYPNSDFAQDCRYRLASYYSAENDLDRAESIIKKAVDLQPDNLGYRRTYADILVKKGNDSAALEIFGETYIMKALINNQNDYDRASVLNTYSWFWAPKGKNLKSALQAVNRALELDPGRANIYDTKSMALWKMGRLKEALEAEEKAYSLNPADGFKKQIEAIKKDMEQAK